MRRRSRNHKKIFFIMTPEGEPTEEFFFDKLKKKYGKENVCDMRYPKKLTDRINMLVDAVMGKDAHATWKNQLKAIRNEKYGKEPERDEWMDLDINGERWKNLMEYVPLSALISGLDSLCRDNKKALSIINKICLRLRDYHTDYGIKSFLKALGDLEGTKFDFIAVNDGKDKNHSHGVIFFDAKRWNSLKWKKGLPIEYGTLRECLHFRLAGIPYYLLIQDSKSGKPYEFEISLENLMRTDKDILEKLKKYDDKAKFWIPQEVMNPFENCS